MTREEMLDAVIRRLGFEDAHTKYFAHICETYDDNTLQFCFGLLMETKLEDLD